MRTARSLPNLHPVRHLFLARSAGLLVHPSRPRRVQLDRRAAIGPAHGSCARPGRLPRRCTAGAAVRARRRRDRCLLTEVFHRARICSDGGRDVLGEEAIGGVPGRLHPEAGALDHRLQDPREGRVLTSDVLFDVASDPLAFGRVGGQRGAPLLDPRPPARVRTSTRCPTDAGIPPGSRMLCIGVRAMAFQKSAR